MSLLAQANGGGTKPQGTKQDTMKASTTMGTFLRRASALPILLFLKRDVVEGFAPSSKLLVITNCCHAPTTTTTPQQLTLLHRRMASGDDNERSMVDEMNFFKADIPPEIRSEIFDAEAKTQAGQDRAGRLATYATIVVLGLGIAIFNTFLTGLQEDGSSLTEAGFGWVEDNPLNSFLFTGKIGGAIALISAGLSAVMSEVELRGRRENVEKIWQEVQKRKQEREQGGGSRKKNKGGGKKKKKKLQKQAKRLSALSEVMAVDNDESDQITPAKEAEAPAEMSSPGAEAAADDKKKDEGGIVGKIKGFYEQADSMAASQALLLNKELEERGVVEKITDESGLKVIGREAAAKVEEDEKKSS